MKKLIYYILLFFPVLVFGQSINQNYVKKVIYKEGTTLVLPVSPDPKKGLVNISYFDGLGRPIQQIAHKQSGTGTDIVTHIEYGAFGRQEKDFLPYVTTAANPNFRTDAESRVVSYYNNEYGDANPFSEKMFEFSPLNRVLKQGAPGEDWQLDQGHTINFDYRTNTTNEVKLFKANTSGMTNGVYNATLGNSEGNVYYPANQLYKTIVTDENGAKTEEFKDKEGRIVLKRTYSVKSNPQPSHRHDTYYVYDIYGNLTYVIPPKAVDFGTINLAVLNNLCYQYRYDSRNRLAEKKIPGRGNPTSSSTSGWEYIVYDKLDRVVATGPALSPFDNLSGTGWLITKYDSFDRVVYTGWSSVNAATSSANRNTLQTGANGGSTLSESRQVTDRTVNGVTFRYTNSAYPTTNFHILTVNYYDDYTYSNPPAVLPPFTISDLGNAGNVTDKVKGLMTGNWVRVLTTSTESLHELSYTFYDKKARPIRVYQKNHLGGFTQTDTKFDFVGVPEYTITRHKRIDSDTELIIREDFEYTPQGRLLEHKHKINNGATETLSYNEYYELGQLKTKKTGHTSSTPLQTVDYKYNIRGWLTDINDVDLLGNDLFAFKINYNKHSFNFPLNQYNNGNISETYWRTSTDNTLRKYTYAYDDMNRLTYAFYYKPPSSSFLSSYTMMSYDEGIAGYDKNGNITSSFRHGDLDSDLDKILIDRLSYTYDSGNRLMKVTDGSNHPEGFKDGTNTGDDYAYDDFGNLVQDLNRGIVAPSNNGITYNHLNLPKQITFGGSSTQKINYLYNALGKKLRKVITNGTEITTTDYQGIFHYENEVLKFFATAEGYVRVIKIGKIYIYNYVYNFTDHLGNVRLSYTKGIGANPPVIVEESHYYPFGLKHKGYGYANPVPALAYQYKFGNKEYQDELGLNLYDFGARGYMPDLGRWTTMDNLSELYFSNSSYVYALNTPVQAIDPDGNVVIFINGQHTGDGGKAQYWRQYERVLRFNSNLTGSISYRKEEVFAFDKSVMRHLGDNKAMYRDGAMGGFNNTLWETNTSKINLSASNRINAGYEQGQKDASMIIANLARDKTTGEIVETIKIITHSMGGAYGKGYVKALKEYIKILPKEQQRQVKITLVADFDPFQAGKLSADPNVHTQQFTHLGGTFGLAEDRQGGLSDENYYETNGDHSIFTFFSDVSNLQEGTYEWNGTDWECTTCKK